MLQCKENINVAHQSDLEILVLSLICDLGKLFKLYETHFLIYEIVVPISTHGVAVRIK